MEGIEECYINICKNKKIPGKSEYVREFLEQVADRGIVRYE